MTPLKFAILLASFYIVITIAITIYVFSSVSDDLPSLQQLENPKQNYATQIFSDDGELLDHFFIQKRINLPYDSIPKDFINALISIEDKSFFKHWGIYTPRIFGAALKNLFSMRVKEGASTITMQLARNLYFNQENTFSRKLREAITAIQIEKSYTKKEILEMYCNTVAFGRGAYGLQVASQVYFDKPPNMLTTSECAYLAGILKAPENYNGINDYQKAIQRRNLVLKLMYENNFISKQKYEACIAEPINLAKFKEKRSTPYLAPHFVEYIRQQLSKDEALKDYDLYRDGLIIKTTLNLTIQKYAEEVVEEQLAKYQKIFEQQWNWNENKQILNSILKQAIRNHPEYNSAPPENKKQIETKLLNNKKFVDSVKKAVLTIQIGLIVIEANTGAVLALVGASPKFMRETPDAKYSLNHVTQIRRQPGSTFKPFVYASALEEGLTPTSEIECGPYTYTLPSGEVWSPRGTGRCSESGKYTLLKGLALSVNTMSARLITQVTSPSKVIDLCKKAGINSPLRAVPALALGGGGEVSPLELTAAFSIFANDGVYIKPFFVKRIENQFGLCIFEQKTSNVAKDVLPIKTAQQMLEMLKGVVLYGTASRIKSILPNVECAGKTGTTNDFADAWFIGFTPQLLAGVWIGFDDNRITFTGDYGYASNLAAPIWAMLMKKIYSDYKLPYKQLRFGYRNILETVDTTKNLEEIIIE